MDIRKLEHLEDGDWESFAEGYTSDSKYFAEKTESPHETVIRLRRRDLPQPYVKRMDRPGTSLAQYNKEILKQGFSFAAYDRDELVGIAVAQRLDWNRSLWVWELHVKKDHRRMGIGTKLLEAVTQQAGREGLRVVVCETQNTNTSAIQFYRSMGFEMEGIDLSYYTNKDVEEGEVAIFMKLKLPR